MTATDNVCLPIVGGLDSPWSPSASVFRKLGLFPFPLCDANPLVPNSGKQPRFPGWQWVSIHANEDLLQAWDAEGWNLGLCLEPSRLVVLDSDSPEAEAWATANLPSTPWITRTAKGFHRFFRLADGAVAPPNATRMLGTGLDRKSAGGYVVAPGSRHYTGVIYTAEGDWTVPLQDLPIYDSAWLPQQPRQQTIWPYRRYTGDSPVIDRAMAYLRQIPPAVQGQGGDNRTYYVACVLVRGFALPMQEALIAIEQWNAHCRPPWAIEDLQAKLMHAARYGRGPIGAMLAHQVHTW